MAVLEGDGGGGSNTAAAAAARKRAAAAAAARRRAAAQAAARRRRAAAAAARRRAAAAEARRRAAAREARRRRAAAAAAKKRAAQAAAEARRRAAASAAERAAALRERQMEQAARRSAAIAQAAARSDAYKALQRRQNELTRRTGVIKDKPRDGRSAISPDLVQSQRAYTKRVQAQNAIAAQAEAERRAASDKAARTRWTTQADRMQREQALKTAKAGDPKSALALESALARELERSQQTGGTDTKTIAALQQKFEEHAKAVHSRYQQLVARINAALEAGNIEAARKLYYGAAFVGTQKEFIRLFGKGQNALKDGSYSKFYKQYQEIAASQREWWKRQAKASLQHELRLSRRHGSKGESAQKSLDIFNETKLGQVIDHYENYVDSQGNDRKRPVYRKRTIEEELDHQRALQIIQREKLAAQRGVQERYHKALALKEGYVKFDNTYVHRDQLDVAQAAKRLVEEEFGGEVPSFKRSEDLSKFADRLVSAWERDNPRPGRGQMNDWLARRKEYERRVFSYFGSGVPEWWDRLFQTPGISHGLSILQGGVASIGAGARVLGKALNGESQSYYGPTPGDAPGHIKAQMRGKPVPEQKRIWRAFLDSPEGQRWAAKHKSDWERRIQEEDFAFASGFYGEGDIGQKLDALNQYGSRPASDEGINLLFQLLADPTNAIPLKFTTYAARGKYAMELTEGVSRLKTLGAAPKAFLTVSEAELNLRKAFKVFDAELTAKGLSPEQATDLLRERVAGVKSVAERKSVVDKVTRSLGLDPRKVSEAQLFNLIERAITKKADDLGIPRLTQADELKEAVESRIKAADAEKKKSAATLKSEKAKVEEVPDARYTEGSAARQRLANERAAGKSIVTPASKPSVPAKPEFARFGTGPAKRGRPGGPTRPGDTTLPSTFKHEGGYVYRAIDERQLGAPLEAGGYASRYSPQTTYGLPADSPTPSVIVRYPDNLFRDLNLTEGGADAALNVKAKSELGPDRGEVMLADGSWMPIAPRELDAPVTPDFTEQSARMAKAAEADGRPAFRDPWADAIDPGKPRESGPNDVRGGDFWENQAKGIERDREIARRRYSRLFTQKGKKFAEDKKTQPHLSENAPSPAVRAEPLPEPEVHLTEEQWWKEQKVAANAVLTSKVSTRAEKIAARQRIKDIEAAEYAVKVEKTKGTYIPWEQRASFQRRVIRLYGDEVEDLIAPKMIAPKVVSPYEAAVEQVRTYWRQLQSAASGPVQSKVKGIRVGGKNLDHMPKSVFEELDHKMSEYISEARGYHADTRTRGRRRGKLEDSQRPIGKLADTDPIVIKAKQRALSDYAREKGVVVSMDAWDEARKVLWKGHVQNLTAEQLLVRAERVVARVGGDLEETYLKLRASEAKREARRQLGGLAFREMYGHSPESILAEFTARYTDDGTLRHFTPELTAFQRATLEAQIKDITGFNSLDDLDQMGKFLQSANRPPFEARDLTREFLRRIGAWSPRRAEEFVQGQKSWSIWDEAEYWRTSYGEVPEWTNPALLANKFDAIFHDEQLYYDQMRAWGVFSRSQELKLRLDGKTAEEIEKAALSGDEALGMKGRRELDSQRKFVIERYGHLVSKDGKSLHSMPWLMYAEEYRHYLAVQPAKNLPEGFIQNFKELDEVSALIETAMKPFFDKYIAAKSAVDGPVSYHDVFKVASEVQAQLLANPKWARRYRDFFGKTLNAWAWLNRWLIFSNPSFLVTNAVDIFIKGPYWRFTRRGYFNPELARMPEYAEGAAALTPGSIGLDATTAMYRVKQASPFSRLKSPRGFSPLERVADRALASVDATGAVFPTLAGRAELAAKMHLARGMYPKVMDEALKRFNNEELADAFTKNFIKNEVSKMWPTAGDGPLEQLWNRLVPFSSYSVRNKLLFISEAVGHPAILNYVERIGAAIERENLRAWEERHPGVEMPEHLRRRISLPWAPDYYLDLSTFSDSARGLKPIFDMGKEKSILDWTAQWVRVVNPGAQSLVYAMFNAFNIAQKQQWVAVLDSGGFPTGSYKLVTTGWLEPWSDRQADLSSAFWFGEAVRSAVALGVDGWTAGEISQMVGQVFFFNGIETFNKGAVYASFYFSLSEKNKSKAIEWLQNTPEGQYAQGWLTANALKPRDVMDRLKDNERLRNDPSPWFHGQSEEFQAKVRAARDEISRIRDAFAIELAQLTPGTAVYREMKARMYMAINAVYRNNPELMISDIYGKSASEWSQQLADWQTDKLMDDFMSLSGQRPSRGDFDSVKEYNKAIAAWNSEKLLFLKTYPQVAARLNEGREALDAMKDRVDKDWDAILTRIGKRNEQIEVAKAILARAGRDSAAGRRAQDRLDALYLANELDFSLLERDYAVVYFGDDDFNQLPFGVQGPAQLRGNILKRATVLLDFDRVRYEKALREGRLDEFLAQQQYGEDMRKAISYAKGGDPFGEFDGKKFFDYMQSHPNLRERYFGENPGKETQWAKSAFYVEGIRSIFSRATIDGRFDPATFVRLLKQNPRLLAEYFKRHPGKEAEWAATDAYIKNISVWGKLVGAGRWDEAGRAWDALPRWVRERYLSTHPDSKMSMSGDFVGGGSAIKYDGQFFKSIASRDRYIAGKAYFNAISPWGKAAAAGDWDKADAIWASLPQWVKDRYNAKHGKKAQSVKTVQYLGYMKRWVSMFEAGDSDKAMQYFRSLPEWAKERYYKAHPEKRLAFEQNNKMTAKLRDYFAGDTDARAAFLKANPDLAKWLAENGTSKEAERIAILEAYRSIPSGEAWLKRVFREKYPDIFSKEAAGERRLRRVFDTLTDHPEMTSLFEKWVASIWDTYAKMLMHGQSRPLSSYFETNRKVPRRKYFKSLSAAEASNL